MMDGKECVLRSARALTQTDLTLPYLKKARALLFVARKEVMCWCSLLVVLLRARYLTLTIYSEQRTPTCNKRSRHGGTFPTQGDAILRNVKPVIPSVLVSLPRYIIKCSGGKDGLVC